MDEPIRVFRSAFARLAPVLLPGLLLTAAPSIGRAAAVSDRWEEAGATLRLRVVQPRDGGDPSALVEIDLKPGWKTYWRNPGPVGIAPEFQWRVDPGVLIAPPLFPLPIVFQEGTTESVGYDQPLAIIVPLTGSGSEPLQVSATVTLGLCQVQCVPVHAELAAEVSGDLSGQAALKAARQALPEPADASLYPSVERAGDELKLTFPFPAEKQADLFIASSANWQVAPHVALAPGESMVPVPMLRPFPVESADKVTLDLVLFEGERALSFTAVPLEP